jgi:hypothetical protein
VTFIRFNPDERNGTMQPNMAGRLVVLMATVRRYLAEPPAAFRVEQVHLYYDGEDMRIEDITDKVCV